VAKWKSVRVRQELLTAAERTLEAGHYRSLSEFVSEAIQMRLNELKEKHELSVPEQIGYPVIQERLLCSPHHVWAMVTPEGNIKVGLSDYAQQHLTGIASVHVEPPGYEVTKEQPFGHIETWMFKFDLRAPVSGRITRVNENLREKPAIVNENPYEEGWIAEIKPDNTVTLEEELRDLMSSRQYKVWALEHKRLIDFARRSSG
jgi:glycine cleavage system H protein